MRKLMLFALFISLFGIMLGQAVLPTPTNLHIIDDVLHWDAIENATGYTVNVVLVATVWLVYDTEDNSFEIPVHYRHQCVYFRVMARGSSEIPYFWSDSAWSLPYQYTPSHMEILATPTNLRIVDNLLLWDPVPNATAYKMYICTFWNPWDGPIVETNQFCVLNLTGPGGSLGLKVMAIGDQTNFLNSPWSNIIVYTWPGAEQLPTPTNVHLVGQVLHWNPVPNARGYNIKINDNIHSFVHTTTSCHIHTYYHDSSIAISVRAVGNGSTYSDSEWSEPVILELLPRLPAPINVYFDGNILRWDPVENAVGYIVDIATVLTMVINYETVVNYWEISNEWYACSYHGFAVGAIGDQINYRSSFGSSRIPFGGDSSDFLPPENLQIVYPCANSVRFTWDMPELDERYVYYTRFFVWSINGVEVQEVWNTNTWRDISHLQNGTYTLSVSAVYGFGNFFHATSTSYLIDENLYRTNDRDMVVSHKTRLATNYPNPFNPETSIRFTVDSGQRIANSEQSAVGHQQVTIDIFNIRGQLVRTLVDSEFARGEHSVVWNGTDDNGQPVGSGVYFYRMTAGEYVETNKMILMK